MSRITTGWIVLSYIAIAALSAWLAVIASGQDADSGQVIDLQIIESMQHAWR